MTVIDSVTALSVIAGLAALAILVWWWIRSRPVERVFDIPTHKIQCGDWEIHYHLSGSGPPLVLVHGIGANLYCWRWILPILRRKFTVIALDLPGFGLSSKPAGVSYGLDDQVTRVLSFLDALKIDRFFLVGSSMGGNISLWITRRAPDRVLGVCVIGPATSPRLVPLSVRRWAWLSKPASLMLTRPLVRWVHRRTVTRKDRVDDLRVDHSYRIYRGDASAVKSFLLATEAIRDRRLPEALRDIPHKVLVLWGSGDRMVPRKVIDQLQSTLPQVICHTHQGGGHHLQEDEPEWVSEKILSFFRAPQF